jgi:hypothetical protein
VTTADHVAELEKRALASAKNANDIIEVRERCAVDTLGH